MARSSANSQTVYSATYSNVPVYEFSLGGEHIMRRRSDDWINATHILKVADYDKPARTRILEREVQKGVHEKVQGGYGKYQGTWIPLTDGRALAAKNGVLEKLLPIFDFVPGDRSPPPAPKHVTAASGKPRQPRAAATARRAPPAANVCHHQHRTHDRDPPVPDDAPDNETVASQSQFDDYPDMSRCSGSRKRRRVAHDMTQAEREHRLWADELLDYFVLADNPLDSRDTAPVPPPNADLNQAIDDRGHNALHWAAAMGDVEVVKDLIRRGARIDAQSHNGETPLMRSVIFTNSFDKRNMEKLAALLIRTVNMQEWFGSTVFHHIAGITQSKKKYECARYYMDCILNKMSEVLSPDQIERVLNEQDNNGDTAITMAARNGARKCVRSLIGRNAAVDIPNAVGETADQLIVQLNHRRQERHRQLSSSPFQTSDTIRVGGGAVQPPNGIPFDPLASRTSLMGSSGAEAADLYKSEAALALTSGLIPDVLSKTTELAKALDAELAEKDAELAEAERVVAIRRAEIEAIQKQKEELRVKELEQTSGFGAHADEQLLRELEELERECHDLTEDEQACAISRLIQTEESKLPASDPSSSPANKEEALALKFHLTKQLLEVQKERRDLVPAIVQALSKANGDEGAERRQQYKRLITGALNVREEDVEGMLPEIVAELEEWRGFEASGA
ncbi:apses-domain-containing protein [Teratosphaeria nubilosa]|uniref:Apses-domain-containing protein n=1 Tax=Teratosphaeria nubilosa TaxID=161662 RepID=A0A6G1LNV0_9PEZI|nr:apses-domain-containing protein [Teratosphaeria nubilosa]